MLNREGHGMIKLFFMTLVVYVNKLDWIQESKLNQKETYLFLNKNMHSGTELTSWYYILYDQKVNFQESRCRCYVDAQKLKDGKVAFQSAL